MSQAQLPPGQIYLPPAGQGVGCPEGDWLATVTKVELKESKSGNPMLNVSVKVTAEKEGQAVTDTIINRVPLHVEFRVQNLVDCVLPDHPGGGMDPAKLVGKPCKVRVHHEEYDGEISAKIDRFLGLDDGDAVASVDESADMPEGATPWD